MSITADPRQTDPKKDKKKIGNQIGDMGNTFYCWAGDLGNAPLAKPTKPAPPQNALSQSRVNGAWEHEKARRLGAVRRAAFLLPPILAQLFVVCFVIFAILLVAHVCDIRSIRGLYNCASPGVLAIIHRAMQRRRRGDVTQHTTAHTTRRARVSTA